MPENETIAYQIAYRSLGDLAEDHAAYLVKKGIAVPWSEAGPAPGAAAMVRLAVPGGASYDLRGRVEKVVEGRGFTVRFDAAAQASLHAIEQLVQSPHFQKAMAAESPSSRGTRAITSIDAKTPRTGSGLPAARPATPAAPVAAAPVPTAKINSEDSYDDYDYEDHDDDDDDDDDEVDDDGEVGTQMSDADEAKPANFRTPGPGESYVVYVLKYATVLQYQEVAAAFGASARFTVPYAGETLKEGGLAQLRLTLPGRNIFTMYGVLEKVRPTEVVVLVSSESQAFLNASTFPRTIAATKRMQNERPDMFKKTDVLRFVEERNSEDLDNMPVRRRLQRMSMDDKVNMALSGTREERMALALDGNKAVHHYLLKNARISLDEIAFMARLPTMNPDVLAKIGENPAYTQNPTVLKNLVYNPKTPVTLAIRLLDRMPRSEVLNLSKRMSMNAKLVQAAKKKIEGRSR